VHAGLRGYLTRHNLAGLCWDQQRFGEAEAQWRGAAGGRAALVPAPGGVGGAWLGGGPPGGGGGVARPLAGAGGGGGGGGAGEEGLVEASVLWARGYLARGEFAVAHGLLERAITHSPRALSPRIFLSHVLLQEGREWDAAERALRAVLALDPENREARTNL